MTLKSSPPLGKTDEARDLRIRVDGATRRLKIAAQRLRAHAKLRTGDAEYLLRSPGVKLTPAALKVFRQTTGAGPGVPDQECLMWAVLGEKPILPGEEEEQGWLINRGERPPLATDTLLDEVGKFDEQLRTGGGVGEWGLLRRLVWELNHVVQLAEVAYCEARASWLAQVHVVAATTTYAAIHRETFEALRPKIVLMEEAAEVLDPLAISALPTTLEHLILLGDHQQLAPRLQNTWLARHGLGLSIMERLVLTGSPSVQLRYQNRMTDPLASLIRPLYPNLLNGEGVSGLTEVEGICQPRFWWDIPGGERGSYVNDREAWAAVTWVCVLLTIGVDPSRIAILTMYSDQVQLIQTLVREVLGGERLRSVTISTVDSFQGQESDVIVLSLVRSNGEGRVGFLADPRRRCVALSRARLALMIIGDFQLVSQTSGWESVTSELKLRNEVGNQPMVRCILHQKDLKIQVETEPRGGFSELLECACPCVFYS